MTIDFKKYIASIKDFPNKGIVFRDITPLIQDGAAYQAATAELAQYAKARGAEVIVGPEARGFIVGCPVANALGIGFVPARKPHKLPRATESASYMTWNMALIRWKCIVMQSSQGKKSSLWMI